MFFVSIIQINCRDSKNYKNISYPNINIHSAKPRKKFCRGKIYILLKGLTARLKNQEVGQILQTCHEQNLCNFFCYDLTNKFSTSSYLILHNTEFFLQQFLTKKQMKFITVSTLFFSPAWSIKNLILV